jgi:hypothetical protein
MAFWCAVSAGEVLKADRLDADYYKPADLGTLRLVRNLGGRELCHTCSILNGRTPPEYIEEGALSVVRSGDLVAPLIYPGCGRDFLRSSLGKETVPLKAGDVLISSIGLGSIGKISLVIEPTGFSTVSEVTVLRDSTYPAEYLWAYLSTREGQSQIEREVTGSTGQQHLLKSKVGGIVIPPPPKGIEAELKGAILGAVKGAKAAQTAYGVAEAALASALGLDRLDLTPRLFYDRSYRDASGAGRLDAEYFNPRAQNLIAALSRDRLTIAHVAKMATRRFRPAPGVQFQYVEIGDVGTGGTAESSPVMAEEAPSRAQWIVQPGDVITTTVRPIRRLSAIVTDDQAGYVCSSGFAVLKPTHIESELLLVYLRLPLVCELLDLHTTASMYPAISTADLMRIPISLPDVATRKRIVAAVRESFAARREGRRLLDEAKALVEKAILPANGGRK